MLAVSDIDVALDTVLYKCDGGGDEDDDYYYYLHHCGLEFNVPCQYIMDHFMGES